MTKSNFFFLILLLLAFSLRHYGINWDQGIHLHPDERMLMMVAGRVHIPDQLNPDFFNYGSLPIYILKGVSQSIDALFQTQIANYNGMLYVGRYLSILFDLGTVLIIYKIASILFKDKKIALFSSFFYAIAFFPIQNSHFFVVDVFLTFFTTLLLFLLLKYLDIPSRHGRNKMVILLGMTFAAMLATKFTAVIFYPIIILVLLSTMKQWSNRITNFLIFNFSLLTFYFLFMPYAFLDYPRFISDITAQIRMNSDPYTFPYTLQYVGTLPYLYYLKNIFLWGLGPIISLLSLLGIIILLKNQRSNIKDQKRISKIKYLISNMSMSILFLIFYIYYFLIIGRSSVKFMRYMLPTYPFLTIMAGYGINQIKNSKLKIKNFFLYGLLTLQTLGTLMFINIYSQKHTRIQATEWILENVPPRSTLAIEHWDDGLPLTGGENYNHVEMTLYDQPDDERKWEILDLKLKTADYIILSSNRLYVPLQKLSDCKKYKSCYPKTAEYYRKLFNNQLGFEKVTEFTVYPSFQISNFKFQISDDSADESFTVYDHPKVMIFKKI